MTVSILPNDKISWNCCWSLFCGKKINRINILKWFDFDCNFTLFKGRYWLYLFYISFIERCFNIMHNNFQFNSNKFKVVIVIFVILLFTITIVFKYFVIFRFVAKGLQHGFGVAPSRGQMSSRWSSMALGVCEGLKPSVTVRRMRSANVSNLLVYEIC